MSFPKGIEEPKKSLDVGDFQGLVNSVGYTDQRKAIFVSLVPDIGADQRADSGRINIGHVRKIEYEIMRLVGTHSGLEFGQCGENERPAKTKNMRSMRACDGGDMKDFIAALDARFGPSTGIKDFAWKSQAQAYETIRAMLKTLT